MLEPAPLRPAPPPRRPAWLAHRRRHQESNVAAVDPIWQEIRREAEEAARNEPALGGFIYATILSQSRLEDAVCHRLAQRLNHSDVDAGLIGQTFAQVLQRPSGTRPRFPRRPRRRLRPRSRLQPLHRAAALLQGLPRARHASLCARAAEAGPPRLRALPAKPKLAHLRASTSIPPPHRHRPHARSRHRHRHRRDGQRSATTARCCRA